MTPEQLVETLQKEYNVKGAIDLAELSTSPQAAYQFFYKLYQSEFANNDRIVLYTSHTIPEEFLQYLYQVINFIDISNWFILICTPSDFVDKADQYSSDPIAFHHYKVNLFQTKEFKPATDYMLSENICAIPWMHLEIRSNGDITPCCMTDNIVVGNINKDSFNDAFSSIQIQELRQQFLNGEKPSVCNRCWKNEDRGLVSIRMHNIKRLKKQFLLEKLSQPEITSIDIKFNNTCNFKCRICGPDSSSLYAAEQKKFLGITLLPQANWSESESFINQVVENLPHLNNIDMFGGEPFLIKKFANVLQIAVDRGYAKNIRLHYNSNGSVWPEEFISYWKHFKEVDIHFSIDAIGERFELQRGGSWPSVEDNILKLKNLNLPNLVINLMPTINIMSVYYIDEVFAWAKQHGFEIFLSNLVNPESFNIKNITADAKELIIEKFKNHPNKEIQKIVSTVRAIVPTDGRLFREHSKWFDSVRQEDFVNSHNEIAKAMGYV